MLVTSHSSSVPTPAAKGGQHIEDVASLQPPAVQGPFSCRQFASGQEWLLRIGFRAELSRAAVTAVNLADGDRALDEMHDAGVTLV
ncbi:MAG TPA: hypothetical protein VMM78_19950 [Thermomicrobiales bacterium]|nr:hypothetical protein [Thermomicrobiales bacterium]